MLSDGPPDPEEIEVSIFGPGKGESVVVHIGHGKWIMVDSCIDLGTGAIPALDYLVRLGVAVDSDVLMVLGTHIHDDHIAGISRVFNECSAAFFACSSALMGEDFVSLLEQDLQAEFDLRKSAYSEFRKIHEIADGRRRASSGRRFLKRAVEDLALVELRSGGDAPYAVVRALSPSHEAVTRAFRRLAEVTASEGKPRKPFRGDPNECSIALWIQALDKTILLGADLLRGPSGCGWAGILSEFKPTARASLIKVPHHGAPNADDPLVWAQLLEDEPVALLAPYRGGQHKRPDANDAARILKRTPRSYITASPDIPAPTKATKRAQARLGHLAINARDPWGSVGQVRARSHRSESEWHIELVPPARELKQAISQRRKRH
jgi:hypothetical protein